MPKVTPGPGQAVESTTVTRLVDASSVEKEKFSSDALEYMEQIPADKWNAGNHCAYIYRVDPPTYRNATGPAYVTKYATPITLEQIQREYGGGLWRILVKKGEERMADRNYQVSGTPRDLTRSTPEFSPASPNGVPVGDPVNLASEAMRIASNPTTQAANLDMIRQSATAAIDLVKANAPKQLSIQELLELAKGLNGSGSNQKPFLETEVGKIVLAAISSLVAALVNRMVAPPADPLDQLSKYAEVMAKFAPTGSSTNDWKAALVQALPQIGNAVKDTVQELRLGTEAQMRLNAGRTLTAAPPPPVPPTQSAPTQPNPASPNVVQMPSSPQSGPPVMEEFESELVKLLNDPQITGDMAGEILDQRWPRIVDEIATYNVDQILYAFSVRPILQPHAQNPRLRQFITEFWEWARDTEPPLTPPAPAS